MDDLLLLARVGSTPMVVEELDLGSVARDVVRPTEPVTVTGDGRARGDAATVGRVLRNLVDNAVRHAGSRVVVVVADGSVRVDDDGAGLDPADRERVFERFVRLDEARQRDEGGSGLGLAIAREIAREQGGDVVLTTADLGGLRAELRLPR